MRQKILAVPTLGVLLAIVITTHAYAANAGIDAGTNEWSFTVNEKLTSFLIGVLLPIVYAAVMKTAYLSEKAKAFVGIVFGAVAALVAQAIELAQGAGISGEALFSTELLYRWAFIQIPMWAAYWGFWQSLKINSNLGPTKGIGPSAPAGVQD